MLYTIRFQDQTFLLNKASDLLPMAHTKTETEWDSYIPTMWPIQASRLLNRLQSACTAISLTVRTTDSITCRKQRVLANELDSEWVSVVSGVPQGSMLRPIRFIIFINDLEIGLVSSILKFADTKVGEKTLTMVNYEITSKGFGQITGAPRRGLLI